MRPHQIAQLTDFLLGIELGSQIHEVKESPKTEAHNKVLAVVEGKDSTGMLLGKSALQQVAIALSSLATELEVLCSLLLAVGIFLALPIAVGASGA